MVHWAAAQIDRDWGVADGGVPMPVAIADRSADEDIGRFGYIGKL